MTKIEKVIDQALASPGLVKALTQPSPPHSLDNLRAEIRAALANVAQAAAEAERERIASALERDMTCDNMLDGSRLADLVRGGSL